MAKNSKTTTGIRMQEVSDIKKRGGRHSKFVINVA